MANDEDPLDWLGRPVTWQELAKAKTKSVPPDFDIRRKAAVTVATYPAPTPPQAWPSFPMPSKKNKKKQKGYVPQPPGKKTDVDMISFIVEYKEREPWEK